MSARFLVSILSMRMESGVRECVESIVAAGGHYKLHLTSNGSEEVATYFDGLLNDVVSTHVRNSENLGYIEPNNRALEYCLKHGHEILVTVNDDARVPKDWLARIDAEFDRHPAAAIVGASGGCRSISPDFHGYAGSALDYIEGSCAAYRVDAVAKHRHALFNPALEFAYGEDSSVSLEMQRMGYTIHEANFQIEHRRGSTSKHVPKVAAMQAKNHAWAKTYFAHWLKHRTFAHRIIVRRMAATGDVLLTTPILSALWRAWPLCTIHVETMFPELFVGNPHVTSAAKVMPHYPTDMVINLDGAYEATPMRHIVRSYAEVAGVTVYEKWATRFRVPHEDAEWATEQLSGLKGCVAIHAGLSTWPGKNWPLSRWVEVIDALRKDGHHVVLVGSQSNPELTQAATLDLTGSTTIPRLFAVLERCRFCISIDSFPLHAAQAVGAPVVGLFGVTTPELICTDGSRWVAARSSEFHPDTGLRHRVAGATMVNTDSSVMETISVDAVIAAIEELTQNKITA